MAVITDYAVSFPLAPGPWTGRNSSIDTGNIDVGRRVTQEVPPGVFWRSLLYLSQAQFLKFNISLGKDALFGVYIRKGLPPSHAQVNSGKSKGISDTSFDMSLRSSHTNSILLISPMHRETISISSHDVGYLVIRCLKKLTH